MTTPDEVKMIFTDLTATFPAIVGQPNDDDIKNLRETITNTLQSIDVLGNKCNLSGLINEPTDYLAMYGKSFDRLDTPLAT